MTRSINLYNCVTTNTSEAQIKVAGSKCCYKTMDAVGGGWEAP